MEFAVSTSLIFVQLTRSLIRKVFFCCFYRSDSRKKNLKEAFDRMVQFHEDMINALTWLTSAESKVAELDSAVEATSTEEQQDMEALRKELKVRLFFLCVLILTYVCQPV